MANAPSAKAGVGQKKLLPFYVGISDHKSLTGVVTKHTHYVMIEAKKAARLGIKSKGLSKPGAADVLENNVIYQTNRKKSTGDKKDVTAKRPVKQGHKSITAYLSTTVKTKKGKEVTETYSIGFPSSVSLGLILKFFKANCPNVVRIGSGGNLYQVR